MAIPNQTRPAPAAKSRQAQRAIQEQIKDWILDQEIASGDPLPSEAELVALLGVSRNSVREALKALQAVDIIEIRHGFGTYVGEGSLAPFADALVFRGRKSLRRDHRDFNEIIDLRQALEVGLIGQLASVIDDESLARLRVCLENLERNAGHGQAGDDADREFHDQLYRPLNNQLLSQLLRVFWDVYRDLSRELAPIERMPDEIVAGHRAIYDALAARDPDRARRAMDAHFAGIRKRVNL